jgi:hypothetical protein
LEDDGVQYYNVSGKLFAWAKRTDGTEVTYKPLEVTLAWNMPWRPWIAEIASLCQNLSSLLVFPDIITGALDVVAQSGRINLGITEYDPAAVTRT